MLPFADPFLTGFLIGAGLIVAIGAQNAFVLRQGLARRHVLPVVAVCAGSDAVLIGLGVAGLGSVVTASPLLLNVATWGGAAFLGSYSLVAFRRALRPGALGPDDGRALGLGGAIAACLAFTWLNPHVYLDTAVLVGSLSARFEGAARLAYAAGAMTASVLWFAALGYGARLLAPLFARPSAWRVLDCIIGVMMALLAATLVGEAVSTV
jgi:L-lysine exporter family protein LysE/ArgO